MKKRYWMLLILSAILYAIPFWYSDILWWLIFIFPIPLLYITCTHNLSYIHGYVWGIIVFLLHAYPSILIIAYLAGDYWWVGLSMGMTMVLYQALIPALLFWLATIIIRTYSLISPLIRILFWTAILAVFIMWTDQYCMWLFDMNGYPFMHPLLPLMQYPSLLYFLPLIGKHLLLVFFLLLPASIVIGMWYRNCISIVLSIIVCMPWLWSAAYQYKYENEPRWYKKVGSLPCMIRAHSSSGAVRIFAQHIQKITVAYPKCSIIIMPESAFDIIDQIMLDSLCEYSVGKSLHLIIGGCSCENQTYYNSLYWIHNGQLRARFDKKQVVLMTECLTDWLNTDWLRAIYFKDGISMRSSTNDRKPLEISKSIVFVPYICSELFFNEYPDDCYSYETILTIVNDTLFINNYMQKLLLLLARLKAMQWQRNVVYVSYGHSVFIDRHATVKPIADG